jgi:hypothetical protein
MAIRVPIVSDFNDKGIKSASSSFAKLKSDVASANGAMGKFKAAGSGAFAAVQANALQFAAVAGAAVVGFAAKAVIAYKDLGLAVGKFADATGVSAEEASRLIEVTGDLNIESSTLLSSLNKMNRAVASGSTAFKDIGAEIARTSTGAVDVNQTFLNVIDALNQIKDPAERAKAATELLGKGWTELSRMVGMGADELKKALEGVADVKVFDDKDVRDAEELDAAFKNLGDKFEEFSLVVGELLVPALTDALEGVVDLLEGLRNVSNFEIFGVKVSTLVKGMNALSAAADGNLGPLKNLINPTIEASVATGVFATAEEKAKAELDATTEALEAQQDALDASKAAWDDFTNSLKIENEFADVRKEVSDFNDYWASAMADGTFEADAFGYALNELKLKVMALAWEILQTESVASQTAIRIAVDTGQIGFAMEMLENLRIMADATFGYVTSGTTTYAVSPYGAMPVYDTAGGVYIGGEYIAPGTDFSGFMAEGGLVTNGPTLAVIGEAGPEAVIPLDRLSDFGGGGGITVNVAGSVVTQGDLIEAIRRGLANSQRNGNQLVYNL